VVEAHKEIRIKDIAEKAKVSIGTVDRVLHDRGEVAEATRKKILEIVKEYDYQPNILARTLASKKAARFATLLPQPPSDEGYWNKPVLGIQKRITELKQYGIEVQPFTFSQTDPSSFMANAEKMLEFCPDGVVMAPFFLKESNLLIQQLKEKRIPFVFIDSDIKEAGQVGYIGQDSYQCGMVAGKLLNYIIPADGNILVLHFAKEMDNQNHLGLRERGFYQWFASQKEHTHQVSTIEIPDAESESWMPLMYKKIRDENISGIFVTNSKVFYVGRLVKKFGLKNLGIIGHDLLKENIVYLKDEIVQFLICQRPEEQGYNAINKLFRHVVQKRQVEEKNFTSIDIVTKENVDYYKGFK